MIKQLLKNNRIVQRIKVLKDLFLQKLDDLQASVDQIKITTDQNLEEIRLELEQKNRNINQILENQIFLI